VSGSFIGTAENYSNTFSEFFKTQNIHLALQANADIINAGLAALVTRHP
jgi:hypothetical protein